MKKNTMHIRIKPDDNHKWKEYCKALGLPSPELFNKILNSKELSLDMRIMNEYKKKEEDLKRKIGKDEQKRFL